MVGMDVYKHGITFVQCLRADAFLRGRLEIFMWVKNEKNMTTIIKIIISTVCSDFKLYKKV